MKTPRKSEFCEAGRPRSLSGLKSVPRVLVGVFWSGDGKGGGSALTRPKVTSSCEPGRQCLCVRVQWGRCPGNRVGLKQAVVRMKLWRQVAYTQGGPWRRLWGSLSWLCKAGWRAAGPM